MERFDGFDERSFHLGMIEAFCEMVARGVKPLAFSPVLESEEWQTLQPYAEQTAARFAVHSFAEPELFAGDLADADSLKGKIVVLYYKDEAVLKEYLAIKQDAAGSDTGRKAASKRLWRLLGYKV